VKQIGLVLARTAAAVYDSEKRLLEFLPGE
jgi:hypothetical protein